jgi:hypothetical protein
VSAREVERLGQQLRELNERAIAELGLAVVAFGLGVAASQLRKDLAVPLLVGGLVLAGLGMVAFVRRHLLVEDAALERDAYLLADVRRYGNRIASQGHRRELAAQIRRILAVPPEFADPRIDCSKEALGALVDELEQPELTLAPVCAAALDRLLHDSLHTLPADELRPRLTQIRAGFDGPRSIVSSSA